MLYITVADSKKANDVRKISVAALTLCIAVGAASAQQRSDPWAQLQQQNQQFQQQLRQQEQRTQAANVATKAEPIPFSLEQLLTAGWTVTTSSMGPMGTQFVLYMQQRRSWALCDLQVVDGLGHLSDQPKSRCLALN